MHSIFLKEKKRKEKKKRNVATQTDEHSAWLMTGKIYFMANLDSYSKDAMYDYDFKKILSAIFLATIYQ